MSQPDEDRLLDPEEFSTLPCSDEILSVTQLNRCVKDLLETSFTRIWVMGEISNLVQPRSGHLYFSLKDEQAQIRCALFRHRHKPSAIQPVDGMQVLACARVSLYTPRGDYQLIVESIEETGIGQLQRQYEQLKQRLAQEGLFDAKYKKEIPKYPKAIGVITSATGAAVRDILHVLRRRFPAIPVFIYPTLVQGNQAAPNIVSALTLAQEHGKCDVLILARGGGSLEDLWPFNEEIVARAVFSCTIPIITGIGHEIDFTIADFVADQRAPTPSAAAELASPRWDEWVAFFQKTEQQLLQLIQQQCARLRQLVQLLQQHLKHPSQQLLEHHQTLDHWTQRLILAFHQLHGRHAQTFHRLEQQLWQHHPQQALNMLKYKTNELEQSLRHHYELLLQKHQHQFHTLLQQLNTLNPLSTLQRGYAIIQDRDTDTILTHQKNLSKQQYLRLRFQDGECEAQVTEIAHLKNASHFS